MGWGGRKKKYKKKLGKEKKKEKEKTLTAPSFEKNGGKTNHQVDFHIDWTVISVFTKTSIEFYSFLYLWLEKIWSQ